MAGVERFELPTRAILGIRGIRCFGLRTTIPKYKYEKGSSLSTRALMMAAVERFELPTRAIIWVSGESAAMFFIQFSKNTNTKKLQSFD
ncbi:hypothetical protein A3K86_07820 [Photobacterium jeanii]|uniref:Uncharacterized protein n=1 Tax=Photobacterium jeanii TaxID=858640 RepID=A0A178KN28_9GAMM|nr:hypothetical protein A3K86_07820 [Photobacterium jeanii]PST86304.1 hypothetical protein C9I91_21955 [Photobacterium jeanii]